MARSVSGRTASRPCLCARIPGTGDDGFVAHRFGIADRAASPIASARSGPGSRSGVATSEHSTRANGRPYEQICRLARRLEIDLIITATRGRTGLKHLALGSTAERVVRHAPCPVLVVHPSAGSARRLSPTFKKILVPIDFSAVCRTRPGLCQSARHAIRVQARPAPFG